ncbi:hypothetical protein AX13_03390 [Comamonas aquatica DA1877]|uniref:Uncharacterized protein n=1 Tax=Comamonas aquatica DA1877 TaxID=1457173 RepID=A0A014MDG2_9BURK|nr:hypothetical protein [Comamonas aquatica]EXU79771.1 hypothetical protein AX13_03390 [Comamonas aquatica DA1877]
MNFSDFLRRAKSSLKFWSAPAQPEPAPIEFHIDEVAERVAKLKVPEPKEPTQFHSLVKLAPIPVPREVRWESQAIYLGAWAGTAALAWGGFQVPTDWLLWYGAAAVLAFAVLFRLEGPRTRAERLQREAEVQRCHEVYLQAEAHLKAVLNEGFNERMEEFTTVRAAYDEACRVLRTADTPKHSKLIAALANPLRTEKTAEEELMEQMSQMERTMLQLVDEMEDYSDTHKVAIDAAIMARHNARLAYWQAKLDEAALTGEAVQQH